MAAIDLEAFAEFERVGWSRIPDPYHRFLGPITGRAAGPLLDAVGIGVGTRVLDVATGPGYVAGLAAARGADVIGVDLSPRMRDLAKDLYPEVEFHVADAARLPFPDGRFDAVVAGFLLPHLADHRAVLTEFGRVLAPGGTVGLSTWDQPERAPVLGLVVEAVRQVDAPVPDGLPPGPPFFAYSDPVALQEVLEGAGLRDVAVASHTFVHQLQSAEALWDGVLAGSVRTAPLVAGQPAATRAAIRAAFNELAAPYETGGRLRIPTSILIATGQLPD